MTDEEINPWAAIIGPCYTATSIARELGWTAQDVHSAAASLVLLELVTDDGATLYPAFQLCNGHPVEGLTEVLRILRTGVNSPWTWAQWLNTALTDEDRERQPSAIEDLRAGRLEDVLREAQHDAWAWSS
nr:hypothetical protein [uncultured Microbacterium sp.]